MAFCHANNEHFLLFIRLLLATNSNISNPSVWPEVWLDLYASLSSLGILKFEYFSSICFLFHIFQRLGTRFDLLFCLSSPIAPQLKAQSF